MPHQRLSARRIDTPGSAPTRSAAAVGTGAEGVSRRALYALCQGMDWPITELDKVLTYARRPNGTRVDPFAGNYASGARAMVASEIRALFAVAARPEVISLAGGMPCVSALPLDVVGDMAGRLIGSRGSDALQYCSAQGDPGLREMICDVMKLEGIRARPDDVVVTVGSQQALDLIARIF